MKLESIQDLGAFVKESRLKYQLTQAQVAYATKVERSVINRLEKGKIDGVHLNTVFKIIKGLNSSLIIHTSER
ncbi:helix-turn-helix domain-containing protein [Leeuwenhoekiella aequorea]|uniref:Helix-turn-helix protein n=1 Tax=Leeuwenhoekiella aequorea TaxID=283736 RepID=A0A4Q0P4J9_9FLAO|nr:helix-turn-helix domain-containing protein [Leeuwenhoekiella aequorea]RXG21038.1 helix-turn-helix protein [Leeuwenhoekiella aequorea]